MKLRVFITAMIASAALIAGAVNVWVETTVELPATVVMTDDSGIAITQLEGEIYLTLSHPQTVEVFTILGQLISREKLPAGTRRLKLSARGIYIVRVGSITRRVTV